MKKTLLRTRGLVPSLLLALTTAAWAQDVRVGGPLEPGHGRPPLHVNVTPGSTPYTPAQIRHAYGFDQLLAGGINGTGQKIALVDAYGNPDIQTDLNTFCAQWGLPATTVQILGRTTRNTGWGLETALDVEWAHAIAPGATIILSVANSSSFSDLLAAIDAAVKAGATVVSMSWGGSEFSGENTYDSHFNVPGVAFTASSGDSAESTGVEWPASSPYVVGVGGTSLYLDANGNRTSPEAAWSDSGGGFSAVYANPSYQDGWFQSGWPLARGVPDVSYVADPNTGVYVYDALNGGWYEVGGTSAGAPQWAALIALANQERGSAGALTSPNGALYSLAQGGATPPYTVNPVNFFDVTTGSDGGDPDDGAGLGYDLVTGIGTPVANNLAPALAPPQSPDFSMSVTPGSQTVAEGGGTTSPGYTVTIAYLGGFTGTVNLTVSGPSGATATFNPTFVSGSGASILTITTDGTILPGSYTLTITGTSTSTSGSLITHSVTATLVVAAPDFSIFASPASRSIKRGSSTTYQATVTASGGFSEAVSFNATGLPSGANATFSPSSVPGSGVSTMTVSTGSRTTPTGSYTLTITGTGTGGSPVHSTTVSLTVTR
jgi:subtilase family serine protease